MANRKKRDLHQAAEDAVKVTRFDRAMSGGLDAISFLPGGPIIAGFLRQVVPQDHLIYVGECLREVADRIEAMEEEKVDREHMSSDAFRGDVERMVEALGDRRNREKRRTMWRPSLTRHQLTVPSTLSSFATSMSWSSAGCLTLSCSR
jgi:hypothetical protein